MKKPLVFGLVAIMAMVIMSLVPFSTAHATGFEVISGNDHCHEYCAAEYPSSKELYDACYNGCTAAE